MPTWIIYSLGWAAFTLLVAFAVIGVYATALGFNFLVQSRGLRAQGLLKSEEATHDWRIEAMENGDYAVAPPDKMVPTPFGPRWRPEGAYVVGPHEIDEVHKMVQADRQKQQELLKMEEQLRGTEIWERLNRPNKEKK